MKQLLLSIFLLLIILSLDAQLLNPGFEDVKAVSEEDTIYLAHHWSVLHSETSEISYDAYDGQFAQIVHSTYNGITNGILSNGDNPLYWASPFPRNKHFHSFGTALNKNVDSLNGYYKFIDVPDGDSMRVEVWQKKYLPQTDSIVIVAYGNQLFGPSETYLPFTVILDRHSPLIPDSIIVQFSTSKYDNGNWTACDGFRLDCKYLFIDNLSLDLVTTSEEISKINNEFIYPNPTEDKIFYSGKLNPISWKIRDITGQLLLQNNSGIRDDFIDVSSLSKGVYILQLLDRNKQFHSFRFLKV